MQAQDVFGSYPHKINEIISEITNSLVLSRDAGHYGSAPPRGNLETVLRHESINLICCSLPLKYYCLRWRLFQDKKSQSL